MRIYTKSPINLSTLSHAWNRSTVLDEYKKKGHFSLFLLEAMSRDTLPAFSYQGRKHPLQKSRRWYGHFDQTIREYYSRHRPTILRATKRVSCKEAARFPGKLRSLIESLGPYKLPCDKVILCPNPFGMQGEGYGPLIGRTAYAVFTPDARKDQSWLMVHETCHSFLLPIFQSAEIKRLVRCTEPLMVKWSTKKFRKYYPKWEWVVEEYMIHAIEQRATGSSVKKKKSWGMNRLPWFIASWKEFQHRRRSESNLSVDIWVKETLHKMQKLAEK